MLLRAVKLRVQFKVILQITLTLTLLELHPFRHHNHWITPTMAHLKLTMIYQIATKPKVSQ